MSLRQTQLRKLLGATPQKKAQASPPPTSDAVRRRYGQNLQVSFAHDAAFPELLIVRVTFDIACGGDSVVMVYEDLHGEWRRAILWQSGKYTRVSGAIGDSVGFNILPTGSGRDWLFAGVHGSPWCTSILSAFAIDVLKPSLALGENRDGVSLFHGIHGFRRETGLMLKREANGFELHVVISSLDLGLMTGKAIYRYRVDGKTVERIQPIANNGRDFVDGWLQAPWADAVHWSDPANLPMLEQVHRRVSAQAIRSGELGYGALTACTAGSHRYQVAVTAATVPKGTVDKESARVYFHLRQEPNAFTMMDATKTPSAACAGNDLLPSH